MNDPAGQPLLTLKLAANGPGDPPGAAWVLLQGRLYRPVEVKHPACARFSLKNEQGLFFVKLYQSTLVEAAQNLPAGAALGVVGELHSFVSRRCQNHHVFIQAVALFPLAGPGEAWVVKIEKLPG